MRINSILKLSNFGKSAAVAAFGLIRGSTAQCDGKKEPSAPKGFFSLLPGALSKSGQDYVKAILDSSEFSGFSAIVPMNFPKKSAIVDLNKSMPVVQSDEPVATPVSSSNNEVTIPKDTVALAVEDALLGSENSTETLEEMEARHAKEKIASEAKFQENVNRIMENFAAGRPIQADENVESTNGKEPEKQAEESTFEATAEKTQEKALNSIANKRRAADGEKDVVVQKRGVVSDKVAEFLTFCEKNPFDDAGKLGKEKELKSLLKDLKLSIEKAKISIYLPELNSDPVVQGYRDEVSEISKEISTWDQMAEKARPYSEAYGRFENLGKNYGDLSKGLEGWKINKRLASENFQTVQQSLIAKAKAATPEVGKYKKLGHSEIIQVVDSLHDQLKECMLNGSVTDELAQAISTHAASEGTSVEETIKSFLGGISDSNEALKKMNVQYSDLKSKLKEVEDGLALIKKGSLDSVDPVKINERVDLIGDCKKEVALVKEELKQHEELMLRIKNEEEDRALFAKLDGQMTDLSSKVSKLSGSKDKVAYKEASSAHRELTKTLEVVDSVWSRAPKEDVKSLRHKKMVDASRENADAKSVLNDEALKQSLNPESSWSGSLLRYGAVAAVSAIAVALFKR